MSHSHSIAELRQLTPSELKKEIALVKAELKKMQLGVRIGSEKDHAKIRFLRREIARMTMVMKGPSALRNDAKDATLSRPQKKSTKPKKTVRSGGSFDSLTASSVTQP
jgi:ribosomal protein L29